MKQNIKNYLKLGILLVGISLFLYQCQKIDDNLIVNLEPEPSLRVKIVHGVDYFAKSNPRVYNKLIQASQSNVLSREIEYSDDYDFYFNLDNIQIIEKANYTQYTVVVERDDSGNDLLNYMLLLYDDGEEFQYLITYPRIQTDVGLEIDHENASIENLDGQSLLSRGFGNKDCIDGAPELVDVTQTYVCEEKDCTGNDHHSLGDDSCPCGTFNENNVYYDCARATTECEWETTNVWSCGGSSGNGNNGSTTTGGGSHGGNDDDDTEETNDEETDDEPIETIALEVEGTETSVPCDKIAEQIADQAYLDKVAYLETKFDEPKEFGFSYKANGTYVSLNNGNGGNSVNMEVTSDMLGGIHTHLNDINLGDTDGDGADNLILKPRMFSPVDLLTFLKLLENANENNLNTSDVFITMISSSGNYTLRFDGDINNLLNTFTPALESYLDSDQAVEDYKKIFNEVGTQGVLLNFIKDKIPTLYGVNLYNIRNNGTVKRKYLDENNKVKTNKCQEN